MRTADTLEPCMRVTRIRMCEVYAQIQCCIKKMCVQQKSVCTPPVAHTIVATTWVRTSVGTTPTGKKSKKNITPLPSLREYLQISLTGTWSTILLFTNHQMYELILLGFPRHALVLILDDAFV